MELTEQEKAQGGKDLGEGSEKTLGTRFTCGNVPELEVVSV